MTTSPHETQAGVRPAVDPTPTEPRPMRPAGGLQRRKSVVLACALSIWPGIGQLYLGYYQLGLLLSLIFIGIITMLSSGAGDFEPFLGMGIGFMIMYSVIDAGRRASIYNQTLEGLEPITPPKDIAIVGRHGSVFGGFLLAAAGVVLLLHTRFDVSMEWLEEWWPALLILFGGYLLIKGIRDRNT